MLSIAESKLGYTTHGPLFTRMYKMLIIVVTRTKANWEMDMSP